MATSSSFIQYFYSILLLLFDAFSLLHISAALRGCKDAAAPRPAVLGSEIGGSGKFLVSWL